MAPASSARWARTSAASVWGRSSGVSPGRTTTSSTSSSSSSGRPVSPTASASPVPVRVSCSTNSISMVGGACCTRVLVTHSARWPTTTTTRRTSTSAMASSTCRIIGRPHRRCRGLGRSDRIRVPSPAARTTAERRRSGIAAFLARRNARRAYGTLVGVPELEAYDEFGLFHENAAEYGLPYDGPPDVRRVEVEVSPGRAVSSLVWGGGPPELVLVHGGAQNAHTWDTVALALGRPLLAVDLPGHGHSDGGPDGAISPRSNGRDLATVIAELAPDARGVVGMSLGGMSSLALAAEAPELVRALVLVDVTPGVNAEKAAPITNFVNGPASFDSFDELLARTIEHNPGRSESSLRRGILHNAVQREDGSWVWRYARFRTEPAVAAAHPDFGDWWEAVSGLTVPLLLVRGLAWSVVDDADVAELLRRQPTATVIGVEGAGHSIQGDRPLELAGILADFLFPDG